MKAIFLALFLMIGSISFPNTPPVACETPSPTIKSVVFDFGGVLAKPDEEAVISYLATFFGVSEEEIRDLHVQELQWIRVSDKEFEIWQKYANSLNRSLPPDWREAYQKVKMDAVRELPEIGQILKDLRSRGYSLMMLSNFEPWMDPLLDQLGYRETFDTLYLSYKTDLEKPSPEAYNQVLEDLQLAGKEVLFIDDQSKNVDAAQELEINSIHFTSAEQLRQELIARKIL